MPAPIECRTCPGGTNDLFSCLLREQRSRLTAAAVSHAYLARETIFHEDTPALAVYCVRSGSIKLFRRLQDGEEVVTGTRSTGELVGLRAVLTGIPYANTATTLDSAVVCAIPGDTFLELVRENASLGFRLLAQLARESRITEEKLVERVHDRVSKRTARFLMRQVRRADVPTLEGAGGRITMSREQMAQLIGTTPETLSRVLRTLADDGVVALDRKGIRVLDRAALLERAN